MAFLAEMDWTDVIGIIGSFFIAGAYFGVSSGRLDGERPPFQIVNLIGALFILTSLYYRPNAGAIMIEVLWVAIAVWSLVSYAMKNK